MNEPSKRPQARAERSVFLPLALVAGVLAVALLNDVYQRIQRTAVLQDRVTGLESAVADAVKVRQQFETLAKGVALLAGSGNANAQAIMTQLNKAGVNVNTNP